MPLRTLIVDDEPVARARLRTLLTREPDIEIVGEAASGRDAIRLIRRHDPDLVLLDIQMPGGDAFEVIAEIGVERMPHVVFVTAYDEYATRAFEVDAIDYVLKPFDRERLADAIARVRDRHHDWTAAQRAERLTGVLERLGARGGAQPPSRIVVRDGAAIRFVRTDDIDWLEAARNYVRLHVGSKTYSTRARLTDLGGRLDPGQFARIHRSAIVNLDRVKEMRHWSSGEYLVELHDGTRLKLSRTYRAELLSRLEGDARGSRWRTRRQ